jgi:hypothetical protein
MAQIPHPPGPSSSSAPAAEGAPTQQRLLNEYFSTLAARAMDSGDFDLEHFSDECHELLAYFQKIRASVVKQTVLGLRRTGTTPRSDST